MGESLTSKRPKWIARKYEKGDERGILELLSLGGIKRTPEDWHWEFQDNPFGSLIWLSECNGKIVGHMAYIPVPMKIGKEAGMGIQIVDVIVHPRFRGQGMLVAMGKASNQEAEEKGLDITYGFPNSPSGHLKYGGFVVCKVPLLVKFLKEKGMADFLKTKYGIPKTLAETVSWILVASVEAFDRVYSRIFDPDAGASDSANVEINDIGAFDSRMDIFWERVSKHYDLVVVRNREFLNWRYSKRPHAPYTILLAEKGEDVLGYVVLQCIQEMNSKTGYIVDILASSKNAAQLLISKAIEHFRKEDASTVRCWMLRNNVYYKILRYNNFISSGSTWFMARVNSPRLSERFVRDYTKWYVTIGDSDYV